MKFTVKFSFTLFAHSLNRLHKIFLSFFFSSLFFFLHFFPPKRKIKTERKKTILSHTRIWINVLYCKVEDFLSKNEALLSKKRKHKAQIS